MSQISARNRHAARLYSSADGIRCRWTL